MQQIIYTIGHSTRTADEFITLLNAFNIELVADVRSYPGSRRYPHFNKENLSKELHAHHILYVHLPSLGGRRKPSVESKNVAWKNAAFRGYADYMESADFKNGSGLLTKYGSKYRTAFMCSEAVWWRCHRSMISDYLKVKGWKVLHILTNTKAEEHPFTSVAAIVDGELSYSSSPQKLF